MRKGRAENVRERKEAGASFGSGGDFFMKKPSALSALPRCISSSSSLPPSPPPPPPSLPPQ